MKLFAKNEPRQAIFYSLGKIAAVKTCQEKLKTQKKLERLNKKTKKQCKVIEKE